jgi:hypothetical protein
MPQLNEPKLSRRRYGIAVRALNDVIASKTTSTARRLKAVEMLLGLYERHDRQTERRDAATRRTPQDETKDAEAHTNATDAATGSPESATEAARRFLAGLGKGVEGNDERGQEKTDAE